MINTGKNIDAKDLNILGDFVAGEDIAKGDAVALAVTGWQNASVQQLSDNSSKDFRTIWYAQSFKVPTNATRLTKMILHINILSNDYTYFYIKDGISGTVNTLYGAQLAQTLNGLKTFTMDVDISSYQGGNLYIIVGCGANNVGQYVYTDTTAPYTDGTMYSATSQNGTYTALSPQESMYFDLTMSAGDDNVIIKASASEYGARLNFLGFAIAGATAGNKVDIDVQDITTAHNQTLTAGEMYYLSDTNGAISTTAGTIDRVIGYASDTQRLLRRRGAVTSPFSISANSNNPVHGLYESGTSSKMIPRKGTISGSGTLTIIDDKYSFI